MANLILNSLEIRNFRGFRHLQIEHLGRVNLIVGKNNVGKSSLLEALQLYAHAGSPDVIWDILGGRDESKVSFTNRNEELENNLSALKYLFYDRKDARTRLEPIRIGPLNAPHEIISITVGWYKALLDENGVRAAENGESIQFNPTENQVPRLTIQIGNRLANYPLRLTGITFGRQITSVFIGANGLDKKEFGEMWDNITLTGLDQEILDALRMIAPGVEGINFRDEHSISAKRDRERIAIVKIAGIDEPLPLRSLGDGMQRLLGISLALANARDGIVLIDEVENGIHHSSQSDLWQTIFRLASTLNVQVFATTHSWDCIEGFQKAAQENAQEEGLLIRLSLKNDEVIATLFDERKLGIATREQIEVR